jgi:YidC/Oxa1 family membrane protein insertase
MTSLFTTILLQPILNLLIWLYNVLPGHDIGFAIIVVTFVVKLILYPLTQAQLKQQRALQQLQPKIEEVRARLKDDKDEKEESPE